MQHLWINAYVYFNFFPVTFFPFLLCISIVNRTKLKKVWITDWSRTQVCKYSNYIWFLSILLLRDRSKWRAKQKRIWGGIMLIQTLVLKIINNERKILIMKSITLQNKLSLWSLNCAKNQSCRFIRTYDAKFLIYLFI